VFALGAVFFAAPIAPTNEVAVLAAGASWPRIGAILLTSLVVTYLILYELEFRGQRARLEQRSLRRRIGQTCMLYVVGLAVARDAARHRGGGRPTVRDRGPPDDRALGFPAAVGASAARVVLA